MKVELFQYPKLEGETVTPEEGKALYAQVKENQRKLRECPRHLFDLGAPPYPFGGKLICKRCDGEMRHTDIYVYICGYIAAGGNANDVAPGYNDPLLEKP